MELDPVLLARIQFAFTISFHIIFPAFTIGLSAFIAVLLLLWHRTGRRELPPPRPLLDQDLRHLLRDGRRLRHRAQSYQFGTNWSRFSEFVGNVIGPLIGYEVLTAFYLEATFLGIMLFGWNRFPPGS